MTQTGVERACADPSLLGTSSASRVGLFTNFTGTMPDLSRNIEALQAAGVPLVALFAPEHGLWGSAPAGESEPSGLDTASQLPVLDTYRVVGEALEALFAEQQLTHLLVDFQDVGARFYTYLWTLYDVMAAAGRLQLPVIVLDRPNPTAACGPAGPGLAEEVSSFVGRVGIPIVTGSTLGELAQHFNNHWLAAPIDLHVIELHGWSRARARGKWHGAWVPPSPNIPTLSTTLAYLGTCFFEGTNVSEGRGTTHPFEQFGAPWIDASVATELRRLDLPGTLIREAQFVPSMSKHADQRCRGVRVHITEPRVYDPLLTGLTVLQTIAKCHEDAFQVLSPFKEGRPPMMDLLWGSDMLRTSLTTRSPDEILAASPAASDVSKDWLYD